MRRPVAVVAGLGGAVALGAAAAGLGSRVDPPPFPVPELPAAEPRPPMPLPPDLPGPVHRWLHGIYGDLVPVVGSVVVTGRARLNPFGFWMPARFRFIHDAGRGYRHHIEACLFGRPVLTVHEHFVDGRARVEIPLIGTEEGPRVDQAANLGMWAELAAAAPSVLATDPRVRWSGLDDQTAVLDVPLGETRDSLVARFDPATGRLRWLEAWRYRSARDAEKVLWIAALEPGPSLGPHRLPAVGTATWADQSQPWARFVTEDLRTDPDVSRYLRARGA